MGLQLCIRCADLVHSGNMGAFFQHSKVAFPQIRWPSFKAVTPSRKLLSQFFAQDDICVDLTPAQREMLDKWNCLTSVQQAALSALMDTMI